MLKEFKEFAMKGNLIDLAVGFVMGAAFTKLTNSFIEGMVMPLVGLIQGKDLSEWLFVLKPAEVDATGKEIAAQVAINYGTFISVAIEFIIVAFVMFLVVKGINRMKRKAAEAPAAPAAPPAPTKEEILLTEIRDLLKK
ncbi:MAG: Large-conductance mechanosensitive channel [Bacteroidota bacterium]